MAHSAGAIYALATALRMPQHIRGKVHLLAPWIPPSQMAPIGMPNNHSTNPVATLPRAQRFLRVLPAPFLKVANSGLLTAASASLSPNGSTRPNKKNRKSFLNGGRSDSPSSARDSSSQRTSSRTHSRRESFLLMDQQNMPNGDALALARSNTSLHNDGGFHSPAAAPPTPGTVAREAALAKAAAEARRAAYDEHLTVAIWNLATTNANPAVDLLVCLERNQPIGFRYVDITRSVVIHHGAKDTRVPVENVKWLGRTMRRCEVRILDGEGHGLMASAAVMGKVLAEMSQEWEDWEGAVNAGRGGVPFHMPTSPERRALGQW